MGKINVLSFAVANLIAAGEVVDRPASVIKELMENSIDSGATVITVEIQNGGVTYMRVSDNGCGMEPDDLPVAIRRHATSKIKNAEDLDGILTLGFRGEALAAIASVSEMRIISKTEHAQSGTMLTASAGNIVEVTERAASKGTTVIVENLFANVPARRKFLKKDVTEAMAVSAVVEKIALSKPGIAFRLIVDGNIKIETVGDGNVKNAVYSVFGREFAAKLLPVSLELDGILVEGFVGRSDNIRANRNYQNFFINGRYVKSKTACAAIEQAYTSYIAPEKFPCCVLFININPSTVDVNVHPAKLEVKFSNEKPVFEAIYYAVKNALEQSVSRPNIDFSDMRGRVNRETKTSWKPSVTMSEVPIQDGPRESLKARQIEAPIYIRQNDTPRNTEEVKQASISEPIKAPALTPAKPSDTQEVKQDNDSEYKITIEEYIKEYIKNEFDENDQPRKDRLKGDIEEEYDEEFDKDQPIITSAPVENVAKDEPIPFESEPQTMTYRIVGEVFNSYVLVEKGDVMLLIDKHAAHERIIFERLKESLKGRKSASQMLMLPIEIMMTSDEIQSIKDYKDDVEALGFEFSAGRYSISVTAIPECVSPEAVSDMLVVMADRTKNGTGSVGLTRDIVFEKALYQASCKAAIKAGREYSAEHIKWIVDKLMQIPDITVCPHGRPVAMEMSKKKLDRQFERT